ncbi:ALF repeat-containing protein [Streptomyces sp. 12297]
MQVRDAEQLYVDVLVGAGRVAGVGGRAGGHTGGEHGRRRPDRGEERTPPHRLRTPALGQGPAPAPAPHRHARHADTTALRSRTPTRAPEALDGTPEDLRRFLDIGQYQARAKGEVVKKPAPAKPSSTERHQRRGGAGEGRWHVCRH